MRNELGCYATWFNDHRPHQALEGRPPTEVYRGSACEDRIIEPRPKWASRGPDQARQARAKHIPAGAVAVDVYPHRESPMVDRY